MIDLLRYLSVVRQSDQDITRAADGAFKRLLELIRQGQPPRKAIAQALREFNADTLVGLEKALSEVLESSLGVKALKDWPVGGVKLSDRLYDNAQKVSTTTRQIIEDHMKGVHRAEDLRKALYEGYDFQQDPLNVNAPLPKYLQVEFDRFKASYLKTPALRAAYLEAIRKAEAGAGMAELEKALKVAFYERNRYFANRIARTELHRNYTDQQAREWMAEDRIQYIQIRLSSKHPHSCICDYHAKADLYGLGPGVYPKADAPKPPFHPWCACLTAPIINLINPKPKFKPKAERAFLRSLPAKEAAQVAGSVEKRRRIIEDGESLEGIYNEGKDELYQWKRVGEVPTNPRTMASMKPQQEILTATKSFTKGCMDAPKEKQPPLPVGDINPAVLTQANALGILIKGQNIALDHDYTRHTLLHHGSSSERNRGQEPISDDDLALAGTILNQTKNLKPGTPPKSKNGCLRLEVIEEVGAYRYTVVYEVRRSGVVVYTMFKRPK